MGSWFGVWGLIYNWFKSLGLLGGHFDLHIVLIYHFVLILVVAFATSLFLIHSWRRRVKDVSTSFNCVRRVLLVTAHPDDECMFFGPAILHFLKTSKLYLVCLSSGNYYGKGETRKRELWESCAALGINPSNIQLFKHDLLLDDPIEEWNPSVVADIILNQIETLTIDMVISFDKAGVSGHKNHVSIYNALHYLVTNDLFPDYCQCYVLNSVSFLRKFLGVLNILFDLPFSSFVLTCSYQEQNTIKLAMAKHESQYVWFRKLFMIFSRYTYINTLSRTS